MKTVRDACQLQPNALSIKLGDQIEQLDGEKPAVIWQLATRCEEMTGKSTTAVAPDSGALSNAWLETKIVFL